MNVPVLIAHRGLFEGHDRERENSPDQILRALGLGFDCEVDLWCIEGVLYLGHDMPVHSVDLQFLRTKGLWIHAKNLEALQFLADFRELNYFWHESDAYTLTSNHYIWTFPGRPLTPRSVAVLPENHDPGFERLVYSCFGICSDFVLAIRKLVQARGA